jgi:hypothetical protein
MELAQDRVQLRALVLAVLKLRVQVLESLSVSYLVSKACVHPVN